MGFRDETQLRKRCAPHRIASAGFFGQNRKLKRSRKTDLGVERSRNPDLVGRIPTLARAWQEASMPGRFAETLDSCPHRTTENFFHSCRLRQQPRHFFSWEESRPWARQGSDAGQVARPGASMPGMWRARYRSRWASPYSLGQPSNKVGRASTKGPLGEPLNFHSGLHACFKAAPAWRGAYSECSARLVPAQHV